MLTHKERTKRKKTARPWTILRLSRRGQVNLFGSGIVAIFLVMAIFGPWIAPYRYSEQIPADRAQPPSMTHWFGTDQFGRDIFSRVVVGARDVFVAAGSATLISVFLGLALGLFSGYRGGLVDEMIMRLFDVMLSLPELVLAMVVLGTLGPSRINILLVVGIVYTPRVGRVVRSVVLDVKTRFFIEAAKLRGETTLYILSHEILPTVLPTLAVEASMRFTYAIFLVASLGFLGLGAKPPSADWGLMVEEARQWFRRAPWMLLFPAGAIASLVVGLSFFSDDLRRMLLPGGVSER